MAVTLGCIISPERGSLPLALTGARIDLIVSVVRGRGFEPKHSHGIFCKFDFYGNPGQTTLVQGTSDPEFDFRQQVTFFRVDHRLLDHLKDGILHIEVWGEQSTLEQSSELASVMGRNSFSFTSPDIGAVRRAFTEANMEVRLIRLLLPLMNEC